MQGLRRHVRGHQIQGLCTVADGVLSDVYSPTVDNTNDETMQYVVTDGHSFTDLQTRDLSYTVNAEPAR